MKILSLDGGGTWALLEAKTLGYVYGDNTPGHLILAQFDLVSANSGGAIVLGGLMANLTPAQLAGMFTNAAQRDLLYVRNIGIAHWSTAKKLVGLQTIFSGILPPAAALPGAVPVAQWTLSTASTQLALWSPAIFGATPPPKLLIAGFNLDRMRETYFRVPPAGPPTPSDNALVIESIHISSTAPIKYFDDPAQATISHALGNTRYWDGAMGGDNNPLLAAVIEGIRDGNQLGSMIALSIGTADVRLPLAQDLNPAQLTAAVGGALIGTPAGAGNIFSEAELGMECIVSDPPASALYDAYILVGSGAAAGGPLQVVRMNPLVRPRLDPATGNLTPPVLGIAGSTDMQAFSLLANLDMDATDQSDVDAIVALGEAWKVDQVTNQPLQEISVSVPPIGPLAASGARNNWMSLVAPPPGGWPPAPPVPPPTTNPF